MKKNVMMRIAAVLLVCVLATTCGISGTFAKYVTEGTGTDTARVAHWGVTITPNGAMFEKAYAKNDNTFTLAGDSVVSSDDWKVVAPGTTHGMTEVLLQGTPEVATRVTYTATVNLDGWTLSDDSVYCPIIFTVEGHTYGMYGTSAEFTYGSIDVLEQAIVEAIAACTKDYVANYDLYLANGDYPSVSWEWPFYTSDENDVKDTDLGNKAAAGNHAVIQITIETTVTQID